MITFNEGFIASRGGFALAGVAVLSVMLVTTVLVSLVMLVVWEKPLALVLPFFLFFFIFEGVYFTANIRKAYTLAYFTLCSYQSLPQLPPMSFPECCTSCCS